MDLYTIIDWIVELKNNVEFLQNDIKREKRRNIHDGLSINLSPYSTRYLKEMSDKFDWHYLPSDMTEWTLDMLNKNPNEINWSYLSTNRNGSNLM